MTFLKCPVHRLEFSPVFVLSIYIDRHRLEEVVEFYFYMMHWTVLFEGTQRVSGRV